MAINEEVYKNLGLKGFLGALPERIYKHLGSLGHVGTISDRLFKEGGYLSYITNLLAALSPVTDGMTLTSSWTVRGDTYGELSSKSSASVRVDATISNTDNGILMEAGGAGKGLILYVYSGVLYFQCGSGSAFGTAANRSETSYILPTGQFDYIVEWSANTSNAVLYVNGLAVDSQTFSDSLIAGADEGTLGEVKTSVPDNRGGWSSDGSGVYTNTITKCDVFVNQVTSDV